jgi:hypothetical protein
MPITLNGTTGISTPNLDSAGTVTTTNLVNGTPLAFRNKIINGNFDIWQRGTTLTVSNNGSFAGFYIADRWGFSPNVNSTVTVSRQDFDIFQTTVPNNPRHFLRFQKTVGSAPAPALYQRMENVRLLAGKTITLSFWAKAAAPLTISTDGTYWYGNPGGSPQTTVTGQTHNITTTWTKYTTTITLPVIASGLSVIEENNFFQIVFNFQTSSTFTFDIAQVQLEEGSVATPFELRPIGTELALCQRYYEKLSGPIQDNGSSTTAVMTWQFKERKRAIPTCVNTDISYQTLVRATLDNVAWSGSGVVAIGNDSTASAEL